MLGWVVCIICYEPFWAPLYRNFFPTKRVITGMIGWLAIRGMDILEFLILPAWWFMSGRQSPLVSVFQT
jgi:hypothetical protein